MGLFFWLLPDFDEKFPAEAVLCGVSSGHDALARGDEDETAAGFNLGDFVDGDVNAASRLGNLVDFVNGGNLATLGDSHMKDVARGVVDDFEVGEVASFFESFDDGDFEF